MSVSAWATLTKQAQIRQSAAAVLIAAGTLANGQVVDTPLQDWTDDQLPAIAIYQKIRRDPKSQAGTDPRFTVNMTLRLQATVISADPATVRDQLDQLEQQTLDALLSDPVWLGLVGPIGGIETTRGWERPGERLRGQVMHDIALQWFEFYPPAADTPLLAGGQPVGVPNATNPVTVPLTGVTITEQTSAGATLVSETITLPQS